MKLRVSIMNDWEYAADESRLSPKNYTFISDFVVLRYFELN